METKPKAIIYNPEWTPDKSRDRLRWVENASRGLRVVGPVHELRDQCGRWPHTGWYLDPLGDGETVHGVVLRLPGRSGFARFVPAISDPWNADCYVVDFHDRYDAPGNDTDDAVCDCARAADRMAEIYAEREREYQTLENAKYRIEEARGTIRAHHKEARDLLRAARESAAEYGAFAPVICRELRRSFAAHRTAVHSAIAEIRKLTADPYSWTY